MKKRILLNSLVFLIVFIPVLVFAGEFQKAEEMFYKCNYSEALINYEKVIDKLSNNKDLCAYIKYQMAECNYRLKNLKESEAQFKTIIEKYPNSSYVEMSKERIADILYNQGRVNEALNKYIELGETSKDSSISANAHLKVSIHYLNKKQWFKADEYYKKSVHNSITTKTYYNDK